LTYIIRRLLLLIPVLIGVSILTFFIINSAGDPVTPYLQNPEHTTPEQRQLIIEKYHLDEPPYIRYFYWLSNVLHGDLGYSTEAGGLPVTEAIAKKFPATFELTLIAMFFSIVFGISLGTISAVRANSPVDQSTRILALIGVSIPVFWLGLMLLYVFYYQFNIHDMMPAGRYSKPDFVDDDITFYTNFYLIDSILNGNPRLFWNVLMHLILPSITLAFASTAIIIRIMRASMLDVLGAEYVVSARAKGLPERVVIRKHARRNAMIPTTTVIGLSFGGLLGGAVVTETVFNWPGLGQWSIKAAQNLDTGGIMGFTLLVAIIYVLANLVVDVIYAYLDPRVRLD